jgi:hypothetical protein
LILDIDFAAAYPAALATLPVLDGGQPSMRFYEASKLAMLHASQRRTAVDVVFVHCAFAFPDDCQYPCLPVPTKDGLKYPLHGVTTCTGIEVALALELGALVKVWYAEWFPPLRDKRRVTLLAFADFLSTITQKRAQEPKGSLRNLMLKEVANSFYGKLAQGIVDRNVYNFTGGSEKLKPSKITTPHYAAMCTGIVRAALSATVYEVGKRADCEVLSATTDGCMIAVANRVNLETDPQGIVQPFNFPEVYPELYQAFKQYHPVMILEQGRLNMGHPKDTWLEIKYIGDYALTLKTRGNILMYKGVPQHVARAGHKVETAEELIALHEADGVPES